MQEEKVQSAGRSVQPDLSENQSLISLAILKVNWDTNQKDYLENFVPIVAESIRHLPQDVISLSELQVTIAQDFGLELSQNSLKTILTRVRKRGYVRLDNRVYYREPSALDTLDFIVVQQQVLAKHEALIAELRRFAAETYAVAWSVEQAEIALQGYITGSERKILAATTFKAMIPVTDFSAKSDRYIVATFVRHTQDSHSALFSYLETIVKGSMLANAVYLPDITDANRRFRNTQVFLDTSFIVFALGYAGQPRKDPCEELLRLLYETGAELRCFQHTVDEVHGILAACARRIRSGTLQDAWGPSMEYFISQGRTESDIEFYINRLERDIGALRIRIVEKPPFIPKVTIDEKGLATALGRVIHYRTQGPLDRDVASISGVMRLRGTGYYFRVEDCRALFVTTNTSLAQAAWDFLMPDATPGAVAPCLTDYNLTNLLWLKKPLRAPDLPRRRLIADCYAAMQPEEHLWRRYLEEVEKLRAEKVITAEDVFLLRHSLEAKVALMDRTRGEEAAFTQGTVAEILKVVRAAIESKVQAQLEVEAAKREGLETELEKEHRSAADLRATIRIRAQQLAAFTVDVVRWFALLVLVVATIWSFPWKLPEFSSAWLRYAVSGMIFLVGVLAATHLYTGRSVRIYLREFETWLTDYFEQRFMVLTGLAAPGTSTVGPDFH